MFLIADGLAESWVLETRIDRVRGQDRQKGKESREGKGRETGLEVLDGVPRLPFAKDSLSVIWPVSTQRLAQAHSWTLTSPLSLAPCPHSTSLSAQTMNKRACLLSAESEQRRAEGRHFLEIVANNSRGLCPEAGREAGNMARLSLRTGNGRADRRSSQRQLLFRIHYWIIARIIETPSQHHIGVWLGSINKPGPLVQNTNMIKFSAVTMATWLMKAPRKTSVFTR